MGKNTKKRGSARSFGAISQINTAPVSIGNSLRGSQPRVTTSNDGARVVGRDFAFALGSTVAAVTDWELIGGMPLTPCVMVTSALKNYSQLFQYFKFNKLAVHYITSSPTSQAGDVLFYYEESRTSPSIDYTNNSFLPFVLSNPNTVIGPQWSNHSAIFKVDNGWKSTLYGNQTDISEDASGSLFVYSKTSSANSPGYILVDYDISFKGMSLNPRAGTLPVSRGQWSEICLNYTTNTTAGNALQSWGVTTGKKVDGVTSAMPTGAATGDIYKVIVQLKSTTVSGVNAAWTGTPTPTAANLLYFTGAGTTALTLDDGFTFYGAYDGAGMYLYCTLPEAVTDSGRIKAQTSITTPNITLCCVISLVGSTGALTQSAY